MIHIGAMALMVNLFALSARSELIYQENFNTEGAGTRYTVEGGGVVPKLGQVSPVQGPSYWARNTDVTAIGEVVGVPFPAAERRALLIFGHAMDPGALTTEGMQLIDATISWLTAGKTNKTVLWSLAADPASPGDQYLVSRLTAMGYTNIDDDVALPLPAASTLALVINSSAVTALPARISAYAVPLLSYQAEVSADLLLATRGSGDVTFDPGDIKIEQAGHPIAAGLPATFKFVTSAQPFDTIGLGLPPGSVTVASHQYTDGATHPFLVVTEKGVQLLGGMLTGFEGSGFWGGADLNEPNINLAWDFTIARSLTLNPINVTGKTNLKLTLAVAGTEVDFDPGGDWLSVNVDIGTGTYTEIAHFTATGGGYLVNDVTNQVRIVAKDLTYDIPDGATQLVVRFEAFSTFWNEIMGFDNIRITDGVIAAPPTLAITRNGAIVSVAFTGVLQSASTVNGQFTDVPGNPVSPLAVGPGFYRSRN